MSEWKETELGKIPTSWNIYKVNELVKMNILEKPLDGNHGEIHPKQSDFLKSGIPFIMASDLVNGRLKLDSCKFISKRQADSLRKGFSLKGDVLLTHKATLGRTAIVGDIHFSYIVLSPQVTYYRVLDKTKLYNKFLKYYFDSNIFQETLFNYASSGSTRNYIGITAQRELPFILPPLPEQKAIAAVLSSLDYKIDLLRRQKKTLEALAETLFRQWFVEEASEDWEEKPLDNIADYLNGLTCQKYPPKIDFEKLPVLKIKELKNGFTENSDWASTDIPEEYIVENGDIIFSWSGSLVVKIWGGEKCVLNQHLFKVTSKSYPKWYFYFWTKFHLDKFISIAESKATTMGHIKKKDLTNSLVLSPSDIELKEMDKHIYPLIEKIINNNAEIRTLEKLRDTLLPKLMNGKVRVKV